ncbi:carboxypeptidase regulatory-like domain-containing protein [Candidatus Poribacteria bacterium]|nr:carboxypeptidase regulatory-like domain-containing protein [Candidatus Poribacteria bacterium]
MIPQKIVLFLLFLVCISACEKAEDPLEPEPEPEKPVVLEYGTVSGTITDAGTGNPIPGAIVKLLESSVETGVEGIYSFQGIVYGDAHTLIVEDADYKPYNEPFVLNQERLVVDVALTPLKDPAVEIQEFFDNFSDLLESLDMENIEAIRALFSETYVAADDPATLFGVASGIIPENYEDVVPAITQLFEEYVLLEFIFNDIEVDVTHARKMAVTLRLDVNAEKGEQRDLRELKAHCTFEFRREGSDWKIVYWQLIELDLRL